MKNQRGLYTMYSFVSYARFLPHGMVVSSLFVESALADAWKIFNYLVTVIVGFIVS